MPPRRPVRSRPTFRAAAALVALSLLASCGSGSDPVAGATNGPVSAIQPSVSGTPRPVASPSVSASARPTPKPATTPAPALGSCPMLPGDNVWHADVTHLPVAARSAAYVSSIGRGDPVHADFGSGTWDGGPIGIPITTVSGGQAKVRVSFQYADESDKGPYPVPKDAAVEGGPHADGDRHVLLVDTTNCVDYELYAAYPKSDGTWKAGSGAIFDLRADLLRPAGWTSGDAAGLPILPGLVTYAEVKTGHIDHAIRVTVPRSQAAYLWPARHAASDSNDKSLPPMGLRLRLKAGVDISKLPTQARIVATAMKKYGVIVADNGSGWYISGAPDPHWSNDQLHALGSLTGADFEAVDESSLMKSSGSGACK